MPIFRVSGKNILFIHIPKAGGTSVETFLSGLSSESFRNHHNTANLPCVPQHFHRDLINTLFAAEFFDYSFCVTRNPYRRTLSEYNYRMQHRKRRYRWLPAPGFDLWVGWTFKRYETDPFVYSNHIRPQVEFPLASTRTFRLEDQISDLMSSLQDVTGVETPRVLPKANTSDKREAKISPKTAERIYNFYKDDFLEFGYDEASY